VEGETVGAELVELVHRFDDVERSPGRAAERVGSVVADGPEAKGEFIVACGLEGHGEFPSLNVIGELLLSKTYQLWRPIGRLVFGT
jgi:hypothetical protein